MFKEETKRRKEKLRLLSESSEKPGLVISEDLSGIAWRKALQGT